MATYIRQRVLLCTLPVPHALCAPRLSWLPALRLGGTTFVRSHMGHKPRSVSYTRSIGKPLGFRLWVRLSLSHCVSLYDPALHLVLYEAFHRHPRRIRGLSIGGRPAGSAPFPTRFIGLNRLSIRLCRCLIRGLIPLGSGSASLPYIRACLSGSTPPRPARIRIKAEGSAHRNRP